LPTEIKPKLEEALERSAEMEANPHQSSEEPTAFGWVDLAVVQANRGWFVGLGVAFVVLGALSSFSGQGACSRPQRDMP
jgi:hypothetical protein